MKSISICIVCLLISLSSGCMRNSNQGDSWRKDWDITANATEANVHKDGYIPFGWHTGEIGGDMANRPLFEGTGRHTGILILHPISINEPARIRYKKELPLEARRLMVMASGNVNGDCLLRCMANGRELGEYRLSGAEWTECLFDLSEVSGQSVDLELLNVAGGNENWKFEHCFIDQIRFEAQ